MTQTSRNGIISPVQKKKWELTGYSDIDCQKALRERFLGFVSLYESAEFFLVPPATLPPLTFFLSSMQPRRFPDFFFPKMGGQIAASHLLLNRHNDDENTSSFLRPREMKTSQKAPDYDRFVDGCITAIFSLQNLGEMQLKKSKLAYPDEVLFPRFSDQKKQSAVLCE